MNALAELPLAVAVLVATLAVLGAGFALIGSIGLLRLGSFYERIHPPTLGTTFGTALIGLASMVLSSALESQLVVHEMVLAAFVVVTTPITFILLLRAAVLRDRVESAQPPLKPPSRDAGGA